MSRAFVRENDTNEVPDFPERPVSEHTNFVTPRGLRQIEQAVRELEQAREAARRNDDKVELARVERDLRYWLRRKASARLVEVDPRPEKVRFGVRVRLHYEDGSERQFTLVGEDEADPASGLISWIAPIAQQLIGREVGEEVDLNGRMAEIVALEPGY